jgi:regulator of protease activity HflC (stomatin/prohibitin superfamily)
MWIIAIILFAAAAVAAAVMFFVPDGAKRFWRAGAVVAAVLAAVCTLISSFNIVSTRNVGIVTSFGRPISERGAGVAWILPWQEVTEMDAAIQLQSFQGNSYDDPQTAVKVRLGNNSAAFVESNLNWRIKEDQAGKMFQDYRTFANIRENLVDKQLQVALSKEFAKFNPQTQVAAVDPNQPTTVPSPAQGANLPEIAATVKEDLQTAVGTEIEIIDVRIPGIFYDSATQQRIDAFNQKVQETKNAQQDVQTATQNRLASEQRANQAPPDLRVAIFNCINAQVAAGKDPAGCWGQIGTGGNPLINIPIPPK